MLGYDFDVHYKMKKKGKKGVGEKREKKKAQHLRKQQSAGEDGVWKECQSQKDDKCPRKARGGRKVGRRYHCC